MIPALLTMLNERATLGLPHLRSGAVLGIDRDPRAKITMLLFGSDGRLAAVAKTCRDPREEAALVAEHAALVALHTDHLDVTAPEVPRPLLLARIEGRPVLVTTAVPGTPLLVAYHTPGHVTRPDAVRADLAAAGDWLARFQQDTAQGHRDLTRAHTEYAARVFEDYRAVHGWGEAESRLAARCAGLARELSGVAMPVVAVHGDYTLGNILTSGHGITCVSGVVDWERSHLLGTPLVDLFKLPAAYGSYLDRAVTPTAAGLRGHPGWAEVRDRRAPHGGWSNLVGFLYAFQGSGWFPDLVRAHLRRGYARLGLPAEAEAAFLPLFVAEQATALADPAYRAGYRDLLRVLAADAHPATAGPGALR